MNSTNVAPHADAPQKKVRLPIKKKDASGNWINRLAGLAPRAPCNPAERFHYVILHVFSAAGRLREKSGQRSAHEVYCHLKRCKNFVGHFR